MAGRMMTRGSITSDLDVVFWQPSRMAITNDLAVVVGQPSQMASSHISSFISIAAALRCAVFILFLPISFISPVHADDLPDPTRPPASIFAPVAAGREATVNHSSGLHTIIISDTRRAAIIDGQTVELGEEHGNARLIEVNEGGVVLQRAQSRQVLTLFPDVKITNRKSMKRELPAKDSLNNNSQIKQPTSESNAQPDVPGFDPAENYEKLLSGHPKEEK
jgi:MSHA biogenesis protein MshK